VYGERPPVEPVEPLPPMPKIDYMPELVLYLSCGEEGGPGRVYQVNEHGHVLGVVNLPYTATGLALHRNNGVNGLVAAIPRAGGKLMKIDDKGNVHTIMQDDPTLVHPVDVGIADGSDTMVIADNVADVLAAMPVNGGVPQIYHKFEGEGYHAQDMSVDVDRNRRVLFGTSGDEGVYRFYGDDFAKEKQPLLEENGGVAADRSSNQWAATQDDVIKVFDGNEVIKEFKFPGNKTAQRNGLLSWGPAGALVAAGRSKDSLSGPVSFYAYQTKREADVRYLFDWMRDPVVDFVVGPRMYWEGNEPETQRMLY